MKDKRILSSILLIGFVLSGCYKPGPGAEPWKASGVGGGDPVETTLTGGNYVGEGQLTQNPQASPTPNPTVVLPTPREETVSYTVQAGDSLREIASRYQVSVSQISMLNNIQNTDLIEVGQVLLIPPPSFEAIASAFKIIPDSELVNSPSNASFDVAAFVGSRDGYLSVYSEYVGGVTLSGAQIIDRVATEYSINPRLLLAMLEYQSGWVTKTNPSEETRVYPMLFYSAWREGLYNQLAWAANLLNEGYYLWNINAITAWVLSDSSVIQVDPTINPGTAGVLNLLRYLKTGDDWEQAVSEEGFYGIYLDFFGYPFIYTYEPMIPENLEQPAMQLPFQNGDVWAYTGGPHGGWDTGSAWAAIDFAPPGDALGCYPSNTWVVASASGEIVYSDNGAVIQDLDGDGIWQTGWSILYMHIDATDRVEVGEYLNAGDLIGHPSCEGGFSTGTHLHIARRYNGEWISADSDIPLNLDGWIAVGYGVEYDGYLVKGDIILEAWNGRSALNAIQR